MQNYEVIDRIGEGTFGEVYKAKHLATGTIVALKRVRIRKLEDGIPRNLLREIQSLNRLTGAAADGNPSHVIRLFEYFPYGSSVVIAVEYAVSDLRQVLKCLNERGDRLTESEIKALLQHILRGVASIHAENLLHRDIKPANLLFTCSGQLVIGDFGLARTVHPNDAAAGRTTLLTPTTATTTATVTSVAGSGPATPIKPTVSATAAAAAASPKPDIKSAALPSSGSTTGTVIASDNKNDRAAGCGTDKASGGEYSHEVATRWYRAPELLFGAKQYGAGVDLWGVATIACELWNNAPLFAGDGDIDQLSRVVTAFGPPVTNGWPEAVRLPDYHKIEFTARAPPKTVQELVPDARDSDRAALATATAFASASATVTGTSTGAGATAASAIDLLRGLLSYSPLNRYTAHTALSHPWFSSEPLPASNAALARLAFLPRAVSSERARLSKARRAAAAPAIASTLSVPKSKSSTSNGAVAKQRRIESVLDPLATRVHASLRDCMDSHSPHHWTSHLHAASTSITHAPRATTSSADAATSLAMSSSKTSVSKTFSHFRDVSTFF